MLKRRGLIVLIVLVLLVMGGAYFAWRHPAVQDALLSRADLSSLRERVAADPTNWRAQYWYGRRSAEAGDLQTAETALRVALGSHPDYLPGLNELGKVLLAQHHVEEAFQVLRMAWGRDTRNVEAGIALAMLYRTQGAYDRAIETANAVLKQDPENVPALYELGAAQALSQLPSDAEATFRHALREAPNDIPSLLGLSRVLRQQEKLDEAEALARKAGTLEPNNADALVTLAQVLSRKHPVETNREEALRLLTRARELDASRSELAWNIAQVHCAAGRWKEALPELWEAVRSNPDQTRAYYLMARAYSHLGRKEESRRADAIFRRRDDYDRQLLALRTRIGEEPENAQLRFRIGDLYAAIGHLDLAITSYRSGLQRSPDDARARRRLADLLKQEAAKR